MPTNVPFEMNLNILITNVFIRIIKVACIIDYRDDNGKRFILVENCVV